jgi:uncharacterized protein
MVEGRFQGGYVRRVIDDELDVAFADLAAVLLDGPKGVGKTATAEQRCVTVRRLDRVAERRVVSADPSVIGLDPPPVLIDEWHRIPEVWDAVRRLVDDDATPAHFLLTGSAPTTATHSGAGRIATIRMRPLCLEERGTAEPTVSFQTLISGERPRVNGRCKLGLADYVDEIMAGGFPGLRHLTGASLARQIDGYLQRIVDHDLAEVGRNVRQPATVLAWLRAYAAATSTTASWESIRGAATGGTVDKPAKTTTLMYTELLKALRILDPIETWVPSQNHFSRLASAPKHHLADPALAVRLLRRTRQHLLTGNEDQIPVISDGALLGNLFESLVALSVRTYAQRCNVEVSHLRIDNGRHEVDFILDTGDGILALEVKLAADIDDHDIRHLRWLKQELGDQLLDAAVITTGPEAYRRPDGIAIIPLGLLGK